ETVVFCPMGNLIFMDRHVVSAGVWTLVYAALGCVCSAMANGDGANPPSLQPAAGTLEAHELPAETGPWWESKDPCPEGAALKGGEPPQAEAIWCERGDGELHGPRTSFHPNGQRAKEVTFRSGKEEGRLIAWHDNGQVAEEAIYRQGQLDGRRTTYYRNGQKESEGTYRGGAESGRCLRFDEEGGQKVYEAEFREGKPHGVTVRYYPSGKKQEEIEYRSGIRHGNFASFHENGQKHYEGKFARDQKV